MIAITIEYDRMVKQRQIPHSSLLSPVPPTLLDDTKDLAILLLQLLHNGPEVGSLQQVSGLSYLQVLQIGQLDELHETISHLDVTKDRSSISMFCLITFLMIGR